MCNNVWVLGAHVPDCGMMMRPTQAHQSGDSMEDYLVQMQKHELTNRYSLCATCRSFALVHMPARRCLAAGSIPGSETCNTWIAGICVDT